MIDSETRGKILIVDDDPAICKLIYRFLSYNNYQVKSAPDSQTARRIFAEFKPNLVILDLNLPDDSGLNLCREMRPTGVLIIILTCMKDTKYILEAYGDGADDYFTKPFDLEILKAKINALFNRLVNQKKLPNWSDSRIVIDHLVIDSEKCEVTLNQQPINLTSLEFDLLYFLASHPYRLLPRAELLQKVWQNHHTGDQRKVDVHIGQIRRKLGANGSKLIQTIRGKGYIFQPQISEL